MSVRRIIAIVVAVLALAGAHAVVGHQAEASRLQVDDDGRRAAVALASDAVTALEAETKNVAARAAIAGSNDTVKRLALLWTDAETVRDVFTAEAAWKPFRDEFDSTVLYRSATQNAGSGPLSTEPGLDALVATVRAQHPFAQIRVVANAARLVGGSTVDVPPSAAAESPVILVCKPLDDALLTKFTSSRGGGLLLSDGQHPMATTAAGAARRTLADRVGHEADSVVISGDLFFAAKVVSPGVWIWSQVDRTEQIQTARASLSTETLGLWAGGALLALLAILLGFWPTSRISAAAMNAGGSTAIIPSAAGLSQTVVSTPGVDKLGVPIHTGTTGASYSSSPNPPALDAPLPPGPPGSIAFGRYVLVDRLGQGGMGDVYVGIAHGAEGFKRTFVVKRLRPELANERMIVAQFIEEARLGATLVHSNIIPVFDFGKVGEEYFLAQEYILGRDLEKLAVRSQEIDGRPLPESFVYYCLHYVLQALAFAHGKTDDAGVPLRLVHRDVSPQNVMVSARGEVKLFDFGIVKSADRANKTQEGMVKGNITFMAPEQARGQEVDLRADLFSLGLVTARLLTGNVLYEAATTYELMVRAATGLGAEQWATIDALPAPAPAILRRALSEDPNARFQTAQEFAAALPPLGPKAQDEATVLIEHLVGPDLRAERERLVARGSGTAPRLAAAAPAVS